MRPCCLPEECTAGCQSCEWQPAPAYRCQESAEAGCREPAQICMHGHACGRKGQAIDATVDTVILRSFMRCRGTRRERPAAAYVSVKSSRRAPICSIAARSPHTDVPASSRACCWARRSPAWNGLSIFPAMTLAKLLRLLGQSTVAVRRHGWSVCIGPRSAPGQSDLTFPSSSL